MHTWGDENVDWEGIDAAASFIGHELKKWGRVPVRQVKEKFGYVCVYTGLGWDSIHDITHPGHAWIRYRGPIKWLYFKTYTLQQYIFTIINKVIVPYHKWLYSYTYGRALKKWPHLREEILHGADFAEYLSAHGVHYIKTEDRSYETRYDWHPDNWSVRQPPRETNRREKIWYSDAEDAITTAMHGSGNDNDRFVLAMQALGFDPLKKQQEELADGSVQEV